MESKRSLACAAMLDTSTELGTDDVIRARVVLTQPMGGVMLSGPSPELEAAKPGYRMHFRPFITDLMQTSAQFGVDVPVAGDLTGECAIEGKRNAVEQLFRELQRARIADPFWNELQIISDKQDAPLEVIHD